MIDASRLELDGTSLGAKTSVLATSMRIGLRDLGSIDGSMTSLCLRGRRNGDGKEERGRWKGKVHVEVTGKIR